MEISAIIPTLNEEETIFLALKNLKNVECIVVDGGSIDKTCEIAADFSKTITSRPGRGCQMNSGAAAASGDIFIFLHADTILPENWEDALILALSDKGAAGGAFSLAIDSKRFLHRLIAAAANIRTRITRIPYGDQGIFVRRSAFEKIGGFKDIPIMEDVDLMQRLKKVGKIILLKDKVRTSARRWEKEGVFYTTARNGILLMLYYLGVSPQRLYKFYKSIR